MEAWSVSFEWCKTCQGQMILGRCGGFNLMYYQQLAARRTASKHGFALQVRLGINSRSSLTVPANQLRPVTSIYLIEAGGWA